MTDRWWWLGGEKEDQEAIATLSAKRWDPELEYTSPGGTGLDLWTLVFSV